MHVLVCICSNVRQFSLVCTSHHHHGGGGSFLPGPEYPPRLHVFLGLPSEFVVCAALFDKVGTGGGRRSRRERNWETECRGGHNWSADLIFLGSLL